MEIFETSNRTFVEAPKTLVYDIAAMLLYLYNFWVVEVLIRQRKSGCIVMEKVNDLDCMVRLLQFEYPEYY